MDRRASQKKAFVLIYVIIAIMLASILAGSLYQSASLSNILFLNEQRVKLAYYTAITGVEYATYIIRSGHYDLTKTDTWPLGDSFDPDPSGNGSVTNVGIDIISDGAPSPTYTITANGQYSGTHKTITASCTSTGSLISWGTS